MAETIGAVKYGGVSLLKYKMRAVFIVMNVFLVVMLAFISLLYFLQYGFANWDVSIQCSGDKTLVASVIDCSMGRLAVYKLVSGTVKGIQARRRNMCLELQNITKIYDKKVLDGVSCKLVKGVYGLLRPNGAGKSTLIRTICDIEPPTSGKVLYEGESVSVLGERYRDILGYLPQKVGFYPDFTAKEFLQYMSVMKGIKEPQRRKRIDEVLELVSLTDTGKKKIKNFSGGMRQRLGIAQAILNNPEILILDEPTAGLDLEEYSNPIFFGDRDNKRGSQEYLTRESFCEMYLVVACE